MLAGMNPFAARASSLRSRSSSRGSCGSPSPWLACALVACAALVGACAGAEAEDGGSSPDSGTKSDSGTHPVDSSTDGVTTDTSVDGDASTCPAPKTVCAGACVDLNTNNENCGACGKACGETTACVGGTCTAVGCTSDQVACPDGTCADLLTDPNHCGDCDTKCGLDSSGVAKLCVDAKCTLDCSKKTDCGGATCVDLNTDDANCGACGHACATGQKCAMGTCVTCPATGTICGTTCVDTTTDVKNCGACGTTCKSDELCIASVCSCPGGLSDCSGTCKDLKDDGTNCGTCGTICATGTVCSGGTCTSTCAPPRSACGTSCLDLTSDPDNCGSCGTICPTGEFCVSGKCSTGTCGRFTGATGTAWETRASGPSEGGQPGWSDGNPAGDFFAMGGTDFARYDSATDTWTTKASLPVSMASWVAPQWVATDTIYMFGASAVLQYTISTNTWTTVKSGLSLEGSAESAHDDAGHLYTLQSDGNLAEFDIASSTVTTLTFAAGGMSEPRMAWDSCANKLYVVPEFISSTFDSYDPATKTTTTLAANPDGMTNDPFCSDRSGHLYAAGATSGTQFWQYTISTNTWTKLPALPADHGFNGACAVTSDGYLYTTPASSSAVYRLQLK